MNNLARDAMLAKQAGMTYGQYKAMQDPVTVKKGIPEGWLVCAWCGKQYKPKTKRKQLYCDFVCQREAQKEKDRERKAKAKTCPQCP